MFNPEEENQSVEVVNEEKVSETPAVLVGAPEKEGELSPNPAGSGFTKQLFVDSLPVTGKPNVLYALNKKTSDGSVVGYNYYKWNKATKAYERVYGSDPALKLFNGEHESSTDTNDYNKQAPEKIFNGVVVINGALIINGQVVLLVPVPPKTDGSYVLECTVADGNPTLTWANKQ